MILYKKQLRKQLEGKTQYTYLLAYFCVTMTTETPTTRPPIRPPNKQATATTPKPPFESSDLSIKIGNSTTVKKVGQANSSL